MHLYPTHINIFLVHLPAYLPARPFQPSLQTKAVPTLWSRGRKKAERDSASRVLGRSLLD
jgi:hypothetical protein